MSKTSIAYIYDIPFTDRRKLCNILDADDRWEELAGTYMKYDVITIALLKKKESPTWGLLDKWGQKNHTINDLFVLLKNMEHYHAMSVIKHLVDTKYHYLFDEVTSNASRLLVPSRFPGTSSLPPPTLPDKSSMVQGSFGGTKSKVYHQDSVNMQNMSIASKPSYDKSYGAQYMTDNPGMSKSQENTEKKEANDNYFATNKWVPEKKALNDTLFSMEDNLNFDLAHVTKKELNIAPVPSAISGEAKILNSRKNSVPENFGLSIRSNDSRVRKSSKEIENALHSTINIDYKQILFATNNFDPTKLIGRGGFGEVYRGEWKNTEVAIKRLKQKNSTEDTVSEVSMNQSLIELKSLINYRHDNILPLYGVSIGGPEPCLVYQYMLNGSLEDRLLCRGNMAPLIWSQRAKITKGAARGVQFLHTSGDVPLIHGDIKSANILLDSNFEPKIGDFGLAREGPQGHYTHVEVSSLHGTQYYLPQEYLRNRKLSTKVDTYSFGIVLFEIATGLRAFDDKQTTCKLLLDLVHEKHDNIGSIKDVKAGEEFSDWFFQAIDLGIQCTNKIKNKRPEMVQVLQKIEFSWQEEELKERGRKISRDGHKLPTNHDLSPVTVQAYYDEMKLSLNAPSAQPEARRPSPNLDMSNANGAIFNYDRFVPKGPPSHYIPPDANASTLSCDANINTDINVTMAWNSPPPNYSDINSNNLPLLTCLGIKNSITEDQTSQNSMKSSLNVDSEDLNSNLDS